MHFVLPANLRSEVAAYDPVLKPLYQAEKKLLLSELLTRLAAQLIYCPLI